MKLHHLGLFVLACFLIVSCSATRKDVRASDNYVDEYVSGGSDSGTSVRFVRVITQTINVTTNVTETHPMVVRSEVMKQNEADPKSVYVRHWKEADPNHKTVTSTVTEVRTYRFEIDGKRLESTQSEILSTTQSHYFMGWKIGDGIQ